VETEVLNDPEPDSEILNDTDWLIDADSLADTEILNESETDSEILSEAD